jgi:hypothetical protein
MKYSLYGLLICLLVAVSCDKPDEVYKEPPADYDTDIGNGFAPVDSHFDGQKEFGNESVPSEGTQPTIEVCSDEEIAATQTVMVKEPIIPMVGAGGLDMTGGEDWNGLTVDEAQSPDMLCQALYYSDDLVGWGDYYELLAIFDEQTREINDIITRSGYQGTIDAGEFVFEMNEPIMKGGAPLDKVDGMELDPRTDANLLAMDRAFLKAFRKGIDADQTNCIEAGSCYLLMSGTQPLLVFTSVGLYMLLEPTQHRIAQMEISLKRPFRLAMGEAKVEVLDGGGFEPSIKGVKAAGIEDCLIEWGTKWSHIESKCLGGDPIKMANITPWGNNQYIYTSLGGVTLYFESEGKAYTLEDEAPGPDDTVAILSINAAYEGNFSMPYDTILEYFKTNLEAEIRSDLSLDEEEKTGVDQLRLPTDDALEDKIKADYKNRLRPGGIYAAFCEDLNDGVGTPDYDCQQADSGKWVLPLTNTLKTVVSTSLAKIGQSKPKYTDTSFYVQHFERAMAQYLQGSEIDDSQINFKPAASRPDIIYVNANMKRDGERYAFQAYYGGNDDRIHFFNFARGVSPSEEILLRDADLNSGGIFSFIGLTRSGSIGLGATNTVTVGEIDEDIRSAHLTVKIAGDDYEALAPYRPASSVDGYWIPLQGVQSIFHPADRFSLSGGTVGANFYMKPSITDGKKGQNEIVAISGSSFYGNIRWCNQNLQIGGSASDLLKGVAEADYPCSMIVRRSENNLFITELYDVDSKIQLDITDDMISSVMAWSR